MKTSTLVIDGKSFKLAYDFNSIADAEQTAGCNLLSALENLNDITAGQLRGLLYAAIVAAWPEGSKAQPPSLAGAGKLIRVDTISVTTEALAEAYMLTLSEETQVKARAAKAAELERLEGEAAKRREEEEALRSDPVVIDA